MLDYELTSRERHVRFIARVASAGEVWGLRSQEGWVVSESVGHEHAEVMPFWSDRAYAQQCAQEEWANYEPAAIPLELFLGDWLPGMAEEGILAGTNWNMNLVGREVAPLDLARELRESLDKLRPAS